MPRVRYIGPGEAILAGSYIQSGDDREVTAAQLAAAQIDHPEGFAVLDEPAVLTLNEPAPPTRTLDLSGGSLSTGGPATIAQSGTGTGPSTPTTKPQPQPKRRH